MYERDLFDEKTWTPPSNLPDLSQEKIIAIDTETCDPNIQTLGPGWSRRDGFMTGIAVATSNWKAYLPIAHEGGGNLSKNIVLRWLKDQLKHGMSVVFHNAQYDLGWLSTEGITVPGKVLDTMIAAPLLDENRFSYSLNALGYTYLGERKKEDDLKIAAHQHGVDAKKEMWKLPASRVASYAETDAKLTLDLWNVLRRKLSFENCDKILDLELSLLPIIFNMRQKGIRVDLDKAEKTKKFLQQKEDKLLKQVKDETGVDIEPWTATSLAKAFDALNLTYERTEKSNAPSFTKHFLKTHKHPIAKKILEIREYNKANTTFIETILNHQYKGRIHCEFNQLRSDDGGTVTGRFSSSHPNLQQVPARHPEIKKMIRGLFLPEEGDKWASLDYSAQEPRWLMHYASLTPATKDNIKVQEIVASYKKDDIDFHQMVADMADIDRTLAKTINLGIMYGMGIGKLAHILGDIPFDEAKSLRAEYNEKVPFIKDMASAVMKVATEKGEIRTLLGRKCRFPMREPKGFGGYKKVIHMDKLEEEWQNILDTPLEDRDKDWRKKNPSNYQVAFTYKALNRLIQSSSADQTKRAMIICHNEGFMPMLTVHDELCFSVSESSKVAKIKTLMENCFPEMKIPSKIDVEVGDSWGE